MARCKAGDLLATTLDDTDRATLRAWLDTGKDDHDRRVSADLMAAALAADGHTVGPTTLKAHRRRACVCFRATTEDVTP